MGLKRVSVVPGFLEVHRLEYTCPVSPPAYVSLSKFCKRSRNRNGQLHYNSGPFSFVLHKPDKMLGISSLILCVKSRKGLQTFRKFLIEIVGPESAQFSYDQLQASAPDPHIAIHAPNILQKVRVRIPGVGSIVTDRTPFSDGTVELELDRSEQFDSFKRTEADFVKQLKEPIESLTSAVKQLLDSFNQLPHTGKPALAGDDRRYL